MVNMKTAYKQRIADSLLASLLVWLFGGEKYMKWYYRYVGDYRNYDKKK